MNKDINKIVKVMSEVYGKDISNYNRIFLAKSVERRKIAIGVNHPEEYCSYLEKSHSEADAFYQSLHINYSEFFRDSMTFAILEQSVFHRLISEKPVGSEIRIWSAGCSKGQEAYSVAMMLNDLAEASRKAINYRIFATDISEEALAAARAGMYELDAVQNLKLKYLNKYFVKQGRNYTVIPQLKQFISFSQYDLRDASTATPPESIYGDFDIILCCNLLIYYQSDSQRAIIKKLQQALADEGYFITGEAEKELIENSTKLPMFGTSTTVFKNNKRGRFQ